MILGVIQARMDSTRLPGKVLLPILNKPVLAHIYERLKFATKIDEICISTSTKPSDDSIINFAENTGIKFFRGSDENLISRHLNAAKHFGADAIVRITADNPLIDPKIIDQLVDLFEKNPSIDFVNNNKVRTFPVGLDAEVIPIKTLEKFFPISENQIFYEYFIGMHIFEHPESFKSLGLELKEPKLLRWTLDFPEDYEFIKQIYTYLYHPGKIFYMDDILSLLDKHPELLKINSMHYDESSHLKYQREKNSK